MKIAIVAISNTKYISIRKLPLRTNVFCWRLQNGIFVNSYYNYILVPLEQWERILTSKNKTFLLFDWVHNQLIINLLDKKCSFVRLIIISLPILKLRNREGKHCHIWWICVFVATVSADAVVLCHRMNF